MPERKDGTFSGIMDRLEIFRSGGRPANCTADENDGPVTDRGHERDLGPLGQARSAL